MFLKQTLKSLEIKVLLIFCWSLKCVSIIKTDFSLKLFKMDKKVCDVKTKYIVFVKVDSNVNCDEFIELDTCTY